MKEQTYHIYLDSHEKTTLLHSLVELKNQLIQQGRYTDCVDELAPFNGQRVSALREARPRVLSNYA